VHSTRYLSTSEDKNTEKEKPTSYRDMMKKYGMTATIVYSASYFTVFASMFLAVDTNIAAVISPSFDYATTLETVQSQCKLALCELITLVRHAHT
jgi:hypothetical protein